MSKKVVFVAQDAAPSGCFRLLQTVLVESGFDVGLLVGGGMPIAQNNEEITTAASDASIVVLGMSSSAELARSEIVAGEVAKNAGIPYGFYGDIPGCWARARYDGGWFGPLAPDATFYFGITQEDADAAREVFPSAQLFGTGNPLREEMAFPRFSREEVRSKLSIASEEKLVLAPGGKFGAGNVALWAIVMEAIAIMMTRCEQKFRLILAVHPGDRTEMSIYEELVSFSPIPTTIVTRNIVTTSDIVPGADIIIEFGSSIGIEGAYQSVPVVTFGLEVLFQRNERINGTRELEIVRDGLSDFVVGDASKLAETIEKFLMPTGFAKMRARQQEFFPKPKKRGEALRKIVESIAQIVS